jgi:hypothetical protein
LSEEWAALHLPMTPPIICTKLESDPPAEVAPTHLTLPFLIFLPLSKKQITMKN